MIGIFTSGGDAPGMNACIEYLIDELKKQKIDPFIIKKGFQGMIDNEIEKASTTSCDLKNISHLGGSVIKCYRCPDFLLENSYKKAVANLKKHKIDTLIAIGGNGTLKGCLELEKSGIKIAFIPGTIDNDLFYTSKTLGYDTALNSISLDLDKIKQTMFSASRGAVVEVMGRECGDLAIASSIASDANAVISCERPFDYSKLLATLKGKKDGFLLVVQENLINVFELAKNLQNDLDMEVRADILGYMQRGGSPSVFDRIYAKRLAIVIAENIKTIKDSTAYGIENDNIIITSLKNADASKKRINKLINYIN